MCFRDTATRGKQRLGRRPSAWVRGAAVLVLLLALPGRGQNTVEQNPPPDGLSGVTYAVPGEEILIYSVELRDDTAGNPVAVLGTNAAGTGIYLNIDDLSTPTGLVSGDFTDLRIYRSTDNVFDGGDLLLGNSGAVNVGGSTLVDATVVFGPGSANLDIPETPAAPVFFLITARISATAVTGHAFRLGTNASPPGHIEIRESLGGPPTDYTVGATTALGGQIVASDANRVVIVASPQARQNVPFRSGWLLLAGMVAYGLWMMRRRMGV